MLPESDIEQALDIRIEATSSLAGGDICEAYLLRLEDGRKVFAKTRPGGPKTMFQAEAFGLEWLGETKTLRVPEVLAAGPNFLALEFLESGPKRSSFDQDLGRGLAALHRFPVEALGLPHDNFIGPLPQPNESCGNWAEFYAERRLAPLAEKALRDGKAPSHWKMRFEELYEELPSLVPDESMSRLHGDLWGGNLHVGPGGEPCLIDPAVYVGHREMDLAMMRLFGGFSSQVFDSYGESYPLEAGWEVRVPLYQLYPLLVHVNLFGSGYVSSVDRALDRLV